MSSADQRDPSLEKLPFLVCWLYLEGMSDHSEVLAALSRGDWKSASLLLDKAQNGPPDGAADGSINARQWEALRDIIRERKTYLAARDVFLQRWGLKKWP